MNFKYSTNELLNKVPWELDFLTRIKKVVDYENGYNLGQSIEPKMKSILEGNSLSLTLNDFQVESGKIVLDFMNFLRQDEFSC